MWDTAKAVLRGKLIALNAMYILEKRKTSNIQPNFTLKTTGQRRKKKISRRKEIINI